MKRYISLIVVLTVSHLAVATITYTARNTAVLPTIDGILDCGEWDDATTILMVYPNIVTAPKEGSLVINNAPNPGSADCSGTWYVKWDNQYVYIACRVYDNVFKWLQSTPGPYNGQDAVQLCFNLGNDPCAVFVDGKGTKTVIFDIVPQTSSGTGPSIFRHGDVLPVDADCAVNGQILSDGYIVEAKIAWSLFDAVYSPQIGDAHGIGLMFVDFDSFAPRTLMTDFGNGQNVIGTPSKWNKLILSGADGCAEWGFPDGDINKDCKVDFEDFALLAGDYMKCSDVGNPNCSDVR